MIVESRLKKGTLTIGDGDTGTAFACQATNVRVSPSYDDDGDTVETLCGDTIPAGKKETWTLAGSSIQDFDDTDGFLAYCYEHAMELQPFTWQPNPAAPTWAGQVVVLALEEGGDVNSRLESDWEFECAGRPTRTAPGQTPPPPTDATGATAGNPGTFTPAGSTPPADKNALDALTASPTAAWAAGQHVIVSGSHYHWDGDSWASGDAT